MLRRGRHSEDPEQSRQMAHRRTARGSTAPDADTCELSSRGRGTNLQERSSWAGTDPAGKFEGAPMTSRIRNHDRSRPDPALGRGPRRHAGCRTGDRIGRRSGHPAHPLQRRERRRPGCDRLGRVLRQVRGGGSRLPLPGQDRGRRHQPLPQVRQARLSSAMGKRYLLVGGAGFIGSHLADELLQHGHAVRVYDSLLPQVHGDSRALGRLISQPRSSCCQGDVRDAGAAGARARRRRRGVPSRRPGRRRPEHVRDRGLRRRQRARHRDPAPAALAAAGRAAGRRLVDEHLRRGALPRCRRAGRCRPRLRRAAQLRAQRWEPQRPRRAPARAGADARGKRPTSPRSTR